MVSKTVHRYSSRRSIVRSPRIWETISSKEASEPLPRAQTLMHYDLIQQMSPRIVGKRGYIYSFTLTNRRLRISQFPYYLKPKLYTSATNLIAKQFWVPLQLQSKQLLRILVIMVSVRANKREHIWYPDSKPKNNKKKTTTMWANRSNTFNHSLESAFIPANPVTLVEGENISPDPQKS